MWRLALLGVVGAYLSPIGIMNYSTENATAPLRVAFYDFDKTLAVGSCGEAFLFACGSNCTTYTPTGPCSCNATDTAFAEFLNATIAWRVLGEPDEAINGTDRRDRLEQHFTLLQAQGVELKIISTSWYYQSATNWQNFLFAVMTIANLSSFFPKANILTLNDPGMNVTANKTALMASYLASRGWSKHNGLFVDDSATNIAIADGAIDWLRVSPENGLADPHLLWIEGRANQTFGNVCTCLHGTATMNGTGVNATLCETDNTEDCSACDSGYTLSAPADLGRQTCVAACSWLTVPSGSTGSCNNTRVGDLCSISCNNGYLLKGPTQQSCQNVMGGVAFEGTQSCVAANCSALSSVVNGTAGNCSGILSTGQRCSITCDPSFTIAGPALQSCVGTGPGASMLENNQTCQPVPCPLVLPAGASAGNCTGVRVGETCSLACGNGYSLVNASQTCAFSNGSAAFQSPQTCQAAVCASPSVTNGTVGSCVNKFTGQSCAITCNSGFNLVGPAMQFCNGTGPGAAAITVTQSCQAIPAACPADDIALFLASCADTDLEAICRNTCRTAALFMVQSFTKLNTDPVFTNEFVDDCIRNASALSRTPLRTSNVDRTISQVFKGSSPCQLSSASSLGASLAVLLLALFM